MGEDGRCRGEGQDRSHGRGGEVWDFIKNIPKRTLRVLKYLIFMAIGYALMTWIFTPALLSFGNPTLLAFWTTVYAMLQVAVMLLTLVFTAFLLFVK
jgi:hypothetical protein